MNSEPTPSAAPRPAPTPNDSKGPSVDSKSLLGGRQELNIVHGSDAYVLRVTKNGKLLLTK